MEAHLIHAVSARHPSGGDEYQWKTNDQEDFSHLRTPFAVPRQTPGIHQGSKEGENAFFDCISAICRRKNELRYAN